MTQYWWSRSQQINFMYLDRLDSRRYTPVENGLWSSILFGLSELSWAMNNKKCCLFLACPSPTGEFSLGAKCRPNWKQSRMTLLLIWPTCVFTFPVLHLVALLFAPGYQFFIIHSAADGVPSACQVLMAGLSSCPEVAPSLVWTLIHIPSFYQLPESNWHTCCGNLKEGAFLLRVC